MAAACVVVFGILQLAVVVIPVVLALFLGSILETPAAWLRRHRWPSVLATWAVFIGGLLLLVAVSSWVTGRVISELDQVGRQWSRESRR